MTPIEQAYDAFDKWIAEHHGRCPDCDHDTLTLTTVYAEYHEGFRTGMEAERARVRPFVVAQANDEGLWFHAQTAAEDYVQRALRGLHRWIEEANAPPPAPDGEKR